MLSLTLFTGQNSSHTDFVGLSFVEKYSVRLLLTSKLNFKFCNKTIIVSE